MGQKYLTVPSYSSPEWKAIRKQHLSLHPHCAHCLELGIIRKGRTVDHKIPHRGNPRLWRDPANLQTLCDDHDRSTKQREELRGEKRGCSLTGWPTDEGHFWNGGKKEKPRGTNQRQIGAAKQARRKT